MKTQGASLAGDPAIRRILIIKWSAIGDVVVASAIFEDVRKAFPAAELHLNTLPAMQTLFENDPRFSRIIAINVREKGHKLRNTWQWLMTIRSMQYDLIIDLQSTDRSILLLNLLRLTGGLPPRCIGHRPTSPYHYHPGKLPYDILAIDRHRASLAAAGIPTGTPRPVLHVGREHEQAARSLMAHHGLAAGAYALLMPGSQAPGYLKRWGVDNYAALARLLLDSGMDKVALIGAEDEMADCRQIATAVGGDVVNLCGMTRIMDIIPLARHARCIVANDTGTAHIASATETPMIVICGPTDPRRVKPAGDNVMAIQADIECRNCYRKQDCSHHSCMKRVTPDMVMTLLNQPRGERPAGLLVF